MTTVRRTASGRISKPKRTMSRGTVRRTVQRTALRSAISNRAARRTKLNNMPNAQLGSIFNSLNGAELARMKTTSKRYRNYINSRPDLVARVNLARRKHITRGHVLAEIRLTNGTMFQLNQENKNRFMRHIMNRPGNNHPLTRLQIRQGLLAFFH
jgi:hypothetical protein